jgi:uncharacterized protein (DUF983 family)
MTWNKMTKVLCPQNGMKQTFANGTKTNRARCTKCGSDTHSNG